MLIILKTVWLKLSLCYYLLFRCQADVFTIGYLTGSKRTELDSDYKRPGIWISGAITLAIEEINADDTLLSGHKLEFLVAETYGQETESIRQTALLWTKNISTYIGPQETCVCEARMAASFNLPMISYFCTQYETSNKLLYPTFARTRPPETQISKSVVSVLLHYNWKKIVFLHSKERQKIADTIHQVLVDYGIIVTARKMWKDSYYHELETLYNPFPKFIEQTYRDTRIYLVLGVYYEHIGLMYSLEERHLLDTGEYFVLGVDINNYDSEFPDKYLNGLFEKTNESIKKAFQSYICVIPSPPVLPQFKNFSILVNKYLKMAPFNFSNFLEQIGGLKKITAEAAYLYDAVHIYAQALNDTLKNGEDPFNGTAIFNYLKGKTYQSAMGYMVHMDENGDAEGNYTLLARKRKPDQQEIYGLYPVGVFHLQEDHNATPVLHLIGNKSLDWVTGYPVIGEPKCGFRGEKCIPEITYTAEIAGGIIGGACFILLIVLLLAYRNWKYEQDLASLLWKIDSKDIQLSEDGYFPHTHSNNKMSNLRASQISLASYADPDFRYTIIYTDVAVYKGSVVAVKKINKKTVELTRRVRKELKVMREMRHPNINAFIGACVDLSYICVISEYCSKGSLQDILENDDVKLDEMFIASLVADIIRGMIYLHESPIKSHGNLKSSNCVVDSRWVLKITDYGLHEFKAGAEIINENQSKYTNLLWRSPELLRNVNSLPHGSQKGDVYSFAIMLYEIHGRKGPYGGLEMSHEEIIMLVMKEEERFSVFRPRLDLLENVPDFVRLVIKECWDEDPDARPDFKSIRTKLKPMQKGLKSNIFDNMIVIMEKYANNLEAVVNERTDQLVEEKKKTEALLHQMLPRSVADQLKRGMKVEAESFDPVTIYFSDIVGFTAMSAESTPLQVVDFLNDLYTCFDSIIENYDVYKVETIGDAYMVVSGLPIRNYDQHAGEIASMSLHLLSAVKKFKVRHRPHETLKLRIGIHSGPVCAGVVGLKMPRYCLFGDTVNTASRMESNGMALRIHSSEQCKIILDKLGGYIVEERGLINIKGKGELRTYWIVGEDKERRLNRLKMLKEFNTQDTDSLCSQDGFYRGGPKRSTVRRSFSRSPTFKRFRFNQHGLDDNKKDKLSISYMDYFESQSDSPNNQIYLKENIQLQRKLSLPPLQTCEAAIGIFSLETEPLKTNDFMDLCSTSKTCSHLEIPLLISNEQIWESEDMDKETPV